MERKIAAVIHIPKNQSTNRQQRHSFVSADIRVITRVASSEKHRKKNQQIGKNQKQEKSKERGEKNEETDAIGRWRAGKKEAP